MKNFFMKTAMKFQRFMTGRYGPDALYKALLVFYLIGVLLCAIIGRYTRTGYYIAWVAATLILVFALFRVFSKNIAMRRKENADWLKITAGFRRRFKTLKNKWAFRKTHLFRKCPHCKTELRLPRHKGTIKATCPHCGHQFQVKTGKKPRQQKTQRT